MPRLFSGIVALSLTHSFTHSLTHASLVRRADVPATLPGNWTSQGCWSDNGASRTLTGSSYVDTVGMTIETCLAFCDNGAYVYSGVEYSQECYCSNTLGSIASQKALTDCSMTCAGNINEPCGGPDRLNLFNSGRVPPSPPVTNPGVGSWASQGCYTDSTAARTLETGVGVTGQMTIAKCTAACGAAGFSLAGAEYAQECYCGNSYANGGMPAVSGCDMVCAGNSSEFCGGPNRLNVYQLNGTTPTPPPPAPPPTSWQALGCYTDTVPARTLANRVPVADPFTISACAAACQAGNYSLAGVEYANECYCGNQLDNGGAPASSGCNMACAGDPSTICGGPDRLNLFQYSTEPPPTTTTTTTATTTTSTTTATPTPSWASIGCYSDSVAARTLTAPMAVTGPMTIEKCTAACLNAGYPLAGAEYSVECYCDLTISNGGAPATAGCTMACAGDPTELCGGPDRLNVYNYTGPITSPPPPPPPGGGDVSPVTTGLPPPWQYDGCWVDNVNGRILTLDLPDNPNLTVESCINECQTRGYTIAGMEYSVQCFCGNTIINAGTVASDPSTCNMGCGGAPTEACGGPNRMSIYASSEVTVLPVPVTQTTGLPGQWEYAGCLAEPGAARVFPYKNTFTTTNSPGTCLSLCSEFGYPAAGMEFGEECFCGDIEDIAANGGVPAPEEDCSFPCSGDPIHLCGGAERLSFYKWTATPLNTWHTPANTGHYEFLIGGLVIPLVAQLGVNNKVAFVEKWGTGPANSTGAYELDVSLVNDFNAAWRTMHVKTDVFCSGGLTLPDKAGRQLNVGGWSLNSTFGLRLYTPDGSPGQPSVNDWEEDFHVLKLQRGRWYPGAMIMANGSALVVGGEQGSNGAPEPTLEVLPKPAGGPTYLFMDWLQRTDPYNLYPYLFVLPTGGILAVYYNEAIILDEVTFQTTKILPNLPAAVNNPLGGRTYPLEGTAVILPQHAPYTDPLVVMACGGSTPGPAVALDNCVTLAPEVPDAQWTIERMPSRRVMTCMVALPDGTFMILNGAHQGVAGFGLATDPNRQAILYDPSLPVGQRFSVLASTIVDRMYHSEAILLHDGRVLVSGSDPEDPRFEQEYRVEVYVPPYLTSGLQQPQYTIANTDWAYDGQYQITVTLFQGPPSGVRVSLLGAVSSTHGSSMGQRTLFPAVSCTGNICTITAPPNAHVCPPGWYQLFVLDGPTPSYSQWVRVGGDPAQFGNWPNLPGFTQPGM